MQEQVILYIQFGKRLKMMEDENQSPISQSSLNSHGNKKKSGYIYGYWTQNENLKYYLFIYHHKQKFQSKFLRKSQKVFKQMSNFIQTRSPRQCRSHHEKNQKKFSSIGLLLQDFIKEKSSFFYSYQQAKPTLQLLEDYDFCYNEQYLKKNNAQGEQKEQKMIKDTVKIEGQGELKEERNEGTSIQVTNSLFPTLKPKNEEQMKDLYECQQLFIKWQSKLNYLVSYPL